MRKTCYTDSIQFNVRMCRLNGGRIVGRFYFGRSDMRRLKGYLTYFSWVEWLLWGVSSLAICTAFMCFDRSNILTLIASLIGVTALIFYAKGNPIGHALMIVFCIIYAVISYTCAYYGEMLTYLCMALPMTVIGLVTWCKNPFEKGKAEVQVHRVKPKEYLLMIILAVIVSIIFYFVLKALNTANLIVSTLSVATSFIPAYLTFRRSAYYALGYAFNDVVLVVLWIMQSLQNASYVAVAVCFTAFLANDLYGFVSWLKMQKRQQKDA